jgi:Tfp pilus assembly protein PilF
MRRAFLFAAFLAVPLAAQTTLIEQGRAALSRDDPETAVHLFEKAVAQAPDSAAAHYWLGDAYGNLAQKARVFARFGLAKQTRQEFERAVQLDPNFLDARYALVEFYTLAPGFLGGSQGKAFQQASEIKTRDAAMGHRAFAFIYEHQKKPDLARKEYIDATNERPGSPQAHYALGVFYLTNANDYKAASDEFETSVNLDPRYFPAWFEIGHTAALSGKNLTRGEAALRKYLTYKPQEDDPTIARALYWLGVIYEKRGQNSNARQSYAASLHLDPNQPDVRDAMQHLR